jgi:hypothetical protein
VVRRSTGSPGRLDRAEEYLRESCDKDKYAEASDIDGEHVDRIGHVWALIKCLDKNGKRDEALALCRELEHNIPLVGGHGLGAKHKFNEGLMEKIRDLEDWKRRMWQRRV